MRKRNPESKPNPPEIPAGALGHRSAAHPTKYDVSNQLYQKWNPESQCVIKCGMVLEEEADIDVGLTCFSIVGASAHTKMKAVAIKSKSRTGGPTTFEAGGTMS